MKKAINILGFGIMGVQLAAFFNVLGYRVTVWNRTHNNLNKRKLVTQEKLIIRSFGLDRPRHQVNFVDEISELPPAITIEAILEDLPLKKSILGKLEYGFTSPWLFTNSSSLEPEEIHKDAYALHFFNPISSMRFVETTCPSDSLLLKDIQEAGMTVIQVEQNRGYIVNYILFREISAALILAEKYGYDTSSIDKSMSLIGEKTSLFDIVDYVGIDVTKSILENLREYDNTLALPRVLDVALEKGILGKKNKTSIRNILDKNV